MFETIPSFVRFQAGQRPDAAAVVAPGRPSLTYAGLLAQIDGIITWLRENGIAQDDRVALVLPNGPEMAVAFLGISAGAISAPLNPSYRAEQFEFFLSDLKAKAVVVQERMDSPVVAVAQALGVAILELSPTRSAGAGIFSLNGEPLIHDESAQYSGANDIALVLHTSGTTSRPKMVSLTHRNLCCSAQNVARSLLLNEADRSLNVMPLFHVHGLVASVLSSLWAGGSVICGPAFHSSGFFNQMEDFRPTWYTAAPAIHQEILQQAYTASDTIAGRRLRFIRSCSSPMPLQLMSDLEEVFGAPVVEAYGMTEAAHQVASNPLPPGKRKPGSVGPAAGAEVTILDENGESIVVGKLGEVAIRGQNVTSGYAGDSAANAAAFIDGWFRTGDQGFLDDDGYLWIKGRFKEIINRGGEKISPREIDDALMKHPNVRHAVAFPLPHPTLGETVAAAIVPKAGSTLNESELREFAIAYLPDFQVPTRIMIVPEIPKGPTGKVQRNGLAGRLAQELSTAYEAPQDSSEELAARTFEELLQQERVGRNDNFFALGGDSITAIRVIAKLTKELKVDIPPTTLFRYPTPALLSRELSRLQEERELANLAAELAKLPHEEAARLVEKASRNE